MRLSPTPPDRPWRGSFGRGTALAACGTLLLVHAARAVILAGGFPYLALLSALAAAAALVCALQLARIDDAISWRCTTALGVVLLAGYASVLIFGLPGPRTAHLTPGVALAVVASVILASAGFIRGLDDLTRLRRPRTSRLAHPAAQAPRGTGPVRPAPPGRARPAA